MRDVGASLDRKPDLRGRASECALLTDLLEAVRRGEGRTLVLQGEPGIGKTALLEHLVDSASEMTVLQATGVESEMELAFAGLQPLAEKPWVTFMGRQVRVPNMPEGAQKCLGVFDPQRPGVI